MTIDLENQAKYKSVTLNEIKTEQVKICNQFSLVTSVVVLLYCIVYYLLEQYLLSFIGFIGLFFLLLTIPFNHLFKYSLAKFNLIISCNLLVMFADTLLAFKTEHQLYYIPGSILSFILFYSHKRLYLVLALSISILCYILPRLSLDYFMPYITPLDDSTISFLKVQNFIGALVITYYFCYLFFKYLETFQSIMINSNKFIALGELSGNVSHEINNPLSVIMAISQKWQRRKNLIDSDRNLLLNELKKIEENSQKISMTVNALKSFSQVEDEKSFESLPVSVILQDILNLYQKKLLVLGVDFQIACPPDAIVSCRRHQLGQVFLNLINNSISEIKDQPSPWIKIEVEKMMTTLTFMSPTREMESLMK